MTNEEIEKTRGATRGARKAAREPWATMPIAIGVAGDGSPFIDLSGERLQIPARCIASTLRAIADAYEDEAAIVRHERRTR